MPEDQLATILEAILFSASEPLTPAKLADATDAPIADVSKALAQVNQHLSGGIRLAHTTGTYRLVTAPEAHAQVRQFLEDTSRQELSKAALESLAIVAYRGPVTKSDIEDIRGVASEAMVRNLLARGLITEAGRADQPGRPQRYAISHSFLQHFGLTSQNDLPPLVEPTHAS